MLFFLYPKLTLRWEVQYQFFFSLTLVLEVSTKCPSVDLESLEVLQGAIQIGFALIELNRVLKS